jgi:hypothetical protein
MRVCNNDGTCNYTSIGGIFVLLKYAAAHENENRVVYRRLPSYEGEDSEASPPYEAA